MADKYVYVLLFHGGERCVAIGVSGEEHGFEVLNARMSLYTPEMQSQMSLQRVEVFE